MHSFFTQSARLLRQSGLWIGLLVASVSGVEAQTVVTFSNPATLTLEEITGGPASIYPSTINISGLTSVVRKVTVTLRSLNHDFPDDFDILLVGPSGTNVMLMSDCVSDNPLFDVTIILDDDAADALPDNDPAIVSGAYRPANYGIVSTETMPSPAPQRPWGSRLDAFTNTIPNGTWSLYVVDDLPENGGTILDGWTLSLTLGEPAADLAVSQSGNMGLLPAGGTLVYTIVVTNRGPANTIATLSDTLPTGVEFVSATTSSGSCAPGPGVVNCALGNLLHNQAATVSLTVRHLSGGALTNFATVTGNAVDLLPDNNVSSTTTAVGAAPDLGVTGFAAPNPAVVRLPITLSLSVTNSGSLAATNVVLTNRLPAGFVFLGATSTLGSCSHAGGVVTCGLGNLAIGAAAQVSISARPEIPGQLTNQFGVTTSGVDPAPLDNSGASGILVQDAADLRLTLASSPASVPLGRDWIAVIAVTNLGPGTTTTKLVQQLGSGVQFISAGGAVHDCTNDNGIIVCDLGPLAARTNALITLTTRPTNLGSAANSLSVTGELVELNPPDNAITLGTTVVPAADLAVSGSVAPNPVWAGETTTYSLAVTNAGPLAANSASLSSLLPAGAVFISANSDQGSCLLSNQTVRCNFGALATGVLARVSITARLNSTGPAPLLASTAATEIDPVSSNNLATIVARVVTVSGQFSTAQIATLPEVGGAIPYPATLQVSGLTATVARVRVTLTNLTHSYPDDLDILLVAPGGQRVLLMSDAGGSFDAIQRTLVFDATAPAALPDSTALTSGTFRPADYEAGTDTFPAPAPAGPYSTNLFDLTGIDPNGTWSLFIVDDSLKDSGTLGGWSLSIATLDPIADLQLTTTTAANPAPVAAPLEILCEITNRGPALATDLRFTNLLSTDVVFGSLSALPSQGGCTVAGGVVTCALGALAPGESAQVVILLTPIEEGQLTNLAFVGATAVDFLPANNATTLIVTLLEPPVIVIDPFDQTVLEGSSVTFTGSAVGAQPLDYQWLRDGIPIPGATTTQLTVATTVAADTGFYQLRVSNAVGVAVSVPAFLLVSGPPFVSVIASQVILEDGMTPALDFVVGDTETSADQILVTGDSSDHLIVPQENILFGGFDSNRTVQIIPLPGRYGEVAIGVYADDGSGNITLRTFLLTVTHVNRPPAISDIANQAAGENSPFSVNFIATDLESSGDSLTYSGSSSNPEIIPTNGIVFSGSGSNRVALVTPATNSFGTAVLTFTVRDSNGASSSDSFTVTVAQLNVHPFVEAIANLTIAEDSGPQIVQLNGIASGPTNEPPGNIQVFAFSDRPAIIPNPVVDYTNGSTAGTLTFAPLTNAAGIANISVVINDGATTNGTFLRTFTVQVTPVNDPPTLQVSATASTVEDTVIRLPIAVSDVDNAPSAITLTAQSANPTLIPPANISFGGAGASRSVTITPASTRSGTAVLTLIATDPQGAQTQAVLTVTIHATNSPPTMDNIANLTLPEDAGLQTITLTGISAGGVGETENVLLSAQSSQPGIIPNPSITHATNASTGSLQFTPAANATGSVTITVTLDDQQSFNRLSTRSFTVSISPAIDPPVLSVISNQVTAEDTALTIPFTVSTADAPAYAVTLSGSSSNATLVPATNIVFSGAGTNRSVTITPARDLSGTNLITLVASSGAGTASRSFTLTVNAVNDLPTINPISNYVTNQTGGGPAHIVSFSGITSGATNESQLLTITASSSNTSLIPNPTVNYTNGASNGTLTLRPSNNPGIAVITVIVTDSGGASVTNHFLAYIKNSNNPQPTLAGLTNLTINEDATAGPLAFTVRDSQTVASNLSLVAVSSNPSLLPTNNLIFSGTQTNRTLTFTPVTNLSGTAAITLTVIDATFGLSNFTFNVTVNPVNDAPTIAAVASVTLDEDAPPPLVSVNVADVDSPPASLVITTVSSNTTLLPNANILPVGVGASRGLILTPATNQSGTAVVTVRVSDGVASNSTTFTLTVNAQNDPPSITGIAAQSADEDTATAPIAFTVSDQETPANELSLSASSSNPTLVPTDRIVISGSGSNRTVVVTPASDQSGTAVITITAADASNALASSSFTLTVRPVNEPPTLGPIANLFINESADAQTVLLTGIGSGSTNKVRPVAVTATTGDTNLILNLTVDYFGTGSTSTLSFQPVPFVHGTATVAVTVNDGQPLNALTTRTFTITIQASPDLSQIGDEVTLEDTSASISFQVGDAESAADTLMVEANSSNSQLLPPGNFLFSGTGSNRSLTITPATNALGVALVTLNVVDPQGSTNRRSFYLTVTPIEDPVIILTNPSSLTLALGETATFSVVATSALLPLTYQWFQNGVAIANETNSILTFSATSETNAGAYSVRVTNADGSATSAAATLTLEESLRIVNFSRIGTTNSISFTTKTGLSYTVEFKDSLNFTHWQSLPSVPGTGGTETVDDASAVAAMRFYRVFGGVPMISGLTNMMTPEDTPVGPVPFTVSSSQPPASNLTLRVESSNTQLLPTNNLVFGGTGTNPTLTITPATNLSGTSTITLTVMNDSIVISKFAFNTTVNPVNDAPTIAPIVNVTMDEDAPSTLVPVNVADIDSPLASLVVTAVSSNTALLPNANIIPVGSGTNRGLTITPAANQFGIAVVTVRVSDGVASNSTTFTVSVNSQNDPPMISGIAAQSTDEDTATAPIPFTVWDVESPASSLALNASSSNPTLVPNNRIVISGSDSNRIVVVTPALDQSGTTIITITATDQGNAAVSNSFAMTVRPVNEPPTLAPISNLTLNVSAPEQTVLLTGISSGSTNKVQSVTVNAATVATNLISNLRVDYPGTGSTATLRFQPIPCLQGTGTVVVTVNDGQPANAVTTQTFTITIRDTTPPGIVCSTNRTVECVGGPGTSVSYVTTASDACETNVMVICTPASGSLFALGTTTVNCSASDASGNSNRCSFTVTVRDTTAPRITCSSNRLIECTSPAGAVVTYATSTSDICDTAPSLVCSPASGSTFPRGLSTVHCVAKDASSNSNACSFTVSVVDTTPPTISCSTNRVLESTGPTGAVGTFVVTTSDICDASPVLVCSPASGSIFPPGVTTVNCVSRDFGGNSNSCSFTVTVHDTTPPTMVCSTNRVVECVGGLGANVSYLTTATDAYDTNLTVICAPAPGSLFPIGTTTVGCSVVDVSGNSNRCSFTVTVRDTTAPLIVCSSNRLVECTSSAGTVATYVASASDFCDSAPSLVCSPVSGSTFPPGVSTVRCVATDASGNSNTCSFTVLVVDTTLPSITCSTNLLLECTSSAGAVGTFVVTTSDICDANPVLVCTPASGTTFAPGLTVVNCVSRDSGGNSNSCSFTVTVHDTTPPAIICSTNRTLECAGGLGATVTYLVTATDACDTNLTVVCSPAPGSLFPLGTTAVGCSVSDFSGNTNSCTFAVTVLDEPDTTPPSIVCSTNLILECTSSLGSTVAYLAKATDACDTNVTAVCMPATGSVFPIGTTTVTCFVADFSGNSNICSFTVTVHDTTAPVLVCSTNLILQCTSPSGAVATYAASASDTCDTTPLLGCSPISGSTFPCGTTTVRCVASDSSGNSNTCSFTVSVVDTTPPAISCSTNISVECASPGGSIATYLVTASDIIDTNTALVCTPASGSTFAPGLTTVRCVATDSSGNSSTCSFTVSVVDTTPPTISCSTNLILECSNPAGAIGTFVVMASDICDPSPVITSSPPSGSTFPQGVTTVTNVARDASGNSNSCTFTVTVQQTPAVLFIAFSGADIIISWTTPCVPGVLEETGSLSQPISWSPVGAPGLIEGPTTKITLPSTGQHRYFRLRQ